MGARAYIKSVEQRFAAASDATKRAIALAACKLAAKQFLPDVGLMHSALKALEAGRYADSGLAKKLQEYAYDLDDLYFAAQDDYRAGHTDQKTYEEMRAKARAAESVSCAFDPDPTAAMSNAVYVACAALGVAPVEAEINAVTVRLPARQ